MNRPYGGVLSGTAVRERWSFFHISCSSVKTINGETKLPAPLRIIRAFLVEEQKIVKKVLKIQKTKDKASKS